MTTPIRILLVEDSEADAKLVIHSLRRADLAIELERIQDAAALREALAAKRCDAVICDWSLPGFDALGALEIFRASGLDVPFIVVSGTVGEELAVTAMRAGAHDYVLKDKLARLPAALERELRESRMREEHRRQERRFRALIEKSSEAVLLTDLEGRIVYASAAATKIFGVPVEQLIGKKNSEFIHPDDLAYATELATRVRRDLAIGIHDPIRVVQPDGTIRFVEYSTTNLLDDPAIGAVVSNLRDITERRLAADALRVSESRFARLAESGIIGILTADVHGNILEVNRAYADMVGYTQLELASGAIKWGDLIPPDLGPSIQQTTAQLVMHGAAAPFESAVIRKDGVRVPMLCGVAMLEFPVCIAFSIDLTERMQAEHALRATEDQLRQAQKMEAVGRLAGGIAHDFNNLLSVILSYAEMLHDDDLADGDPRRGDVGEILGAARRATALTRQLLMFSRQQVLAPKILDLDELLGNMDKMIQRVLGEDVELVTRRALSLGRVKADPSSIEQVMMNLVVNARDAMPTGGTLTIETSDVSLDDEHVRLHIASHAGPHVMITVTDTGTGMDAATRARIFEPFFTTKPKDKGTGLGLSTVFGIVHQAGGGIQVESEVGKGTTFKIYLPQVAGEVTIERATSVRVGRGTETILLVEDEVQVRTVARNILQRHGYCVIEATSAEDAIALCEHDGAIDLLLTDVVMPHMSGPELAKRIVQLRPMTKVLFMSGYTDDAVVRHGVQTSQIALLQKPLSPTTLADKVREVLDGPAETKAAFHDA